MLAVVTTGNGGVDRLDYREVRRPRPDAGEALVRVLAAGVNATDVNTRVGWYEDGGWNATSPFPFIQGTDCCGVVAAVGPGGDEALVGRRVLVRPCMRPHGFGSPETVWMGSDFDGAFAEYVLVPASEVFPVESGLSDAELGIVPCSFGTAENMLARAGVAQRAARRRHRRVGRRRIGGRSARQAARRRGHGRGRRRQGAQVLELGAARVIDRDDDVLAALGDQSADVVVDNVSGPGLDGLLAVLRRGGTYVSSGAIAGPEVSFDKRTFYLRDLTLLGCTAWDEPVFPALIARLERGRAAAAGRGDVPARAHRARRRRQFLEKRHVGSYVLVPPAG